MWTPIACAVRRIFPCVVKKGDRDGTFADGNVVAEAEALLAGRLADLYAAEGRSIPYRVWLNTIAHQTPAALRAVATTYPSGTFAESTIAVADALATLTPAQVSEIQQKVLIPAELAALGRFTGGSPGAIIHCVRRHVAEMRRHSGAKR